ncbi:hypothetical protein Q7C_401 [Methylophaga frappieri]|uniref:Uncharacterized protein n=1 Tax=Methylophaga frappieri (strain ATCC BAA-2434 / DSM 25690 / JAM7) TaxID=754477 RepID=I1YF83_METFJ|nr:hypothetical protein [Methylophaga frappieri]AFJ01576.1 hypothetical protein Q7C_401 [Methylophaga frappieri]
MPKAAYTKQLTYLIPPSQLCAKSYQALFWTIVQECHTTNESTAKPVLPVFYQYQHGISPSNVSAPKCTLIHLGARSQNTYFITHCFY